jgi:hypothetical protein
MTKRLLNQNLSGLNQRSQSRAEAFELNRNFPLSRGRRVTP